METEKMKALREQWLKREYVLWLQEDVDNFQIIHNTTKEEKGAN